MSPETLVQEAKSWHIKTLTLTDINNTSGVFPFVRHCKKEGIKPIVGIEFHRDHKKLYIGLARNAEGFRELNSFLSVHALQDKPLPDLPPPMPNVFILYEFEHAPKPISAFASNEFLGVRPHQVTNLYFHEAIKCPQKLVALSPVTFCNQRGYNIHKLLRASGLNKLGTELKPEDIAAKDECFRSAHFFKSLYNVYPSVLHNTKRLLDSCEPMTFSVGVENNRQVFTYDQNGDFELLKKLAYDGCNQYYGDCPKAKERMDKELKVIQKNGFTQYYLITWDFIRYAQGLKFYHVGRGSGANSLVAHCMGITGVDPLELDLYFERFINEYRHSPPDFDIDFDSFERDLVIDYVLKKYGVKYAALIATYDTFKWRSIVDEIGKVFGIDAAARAYIKDHPKDVKNHHPQAKYIHQYAKDIWGFPCNLGIHPGGVIISQKPLNYFTDIKNMKFPVVSFDMHTAEDWGFHKYDILGNRGIGHIRETLNMVRDKRGSVVDIHNMKIIKNDERVKSLMRQGDCVGAFYVESPAMRGLLKKLKCEQYTELVAASSIIRPGVAQSGMMREYIKRFHQPGSFQYLHPIFQEHLGDTFGIMIYQEDVLKILHHFADLDLGESDVIRRLMSGKKAKGDSLETLQAKYIQNCAAKGYPPALAQEVWRQVQSFSGYSFCKAHSASYAVESMQSLYLKAYFPIEFFTGVINNYGGFFKGSRRFVYFYEAQKAGATLHPPCINTSEYKSTVSCTAIYVGFGQIKGIKADLVQKIVYERQKRGAFKHLEDFVNRIPITNTQLELLVKIGAFRFMGLTKCQTYWEKDRVFEPKKKFEATSTLFESSADDNAQIPDVPDGPYDQGFDEWVLLGFPLCSPFTLLAKDTEKKFYYVLARQLHKCIGITVTILGLYIIRKDVPIDKNGQRQLMHYGCWYDSEHQFFDTTHYPNVVQRFPFRGQGIYRITGKVSAEFGVCSIIVYRMEKLGYIKDERYY